MKFRLFYILFTYYATLSSLHAADWTLKYNKQDQCFEADSFTGFREACVRFSAQYLTEKHFLEAQLKELPEADESTKAQELSFQIKDKQMLAELFATTPTLLQFEAKKYLVELYVLKADQIRHKQKKLDTRFFNGNTFSQSQLLKFNIHLPLLDQVALIKKTTDRSITNGIFVSPFGTSIKEKYNDCCDIENSYKSFVASVEKYTQIQCQGINHNGEGRFFYAKALGVVVGIDNQSPLITVDELLQLKQNLINEYEASLANKS